VKELPLVMRAAWGGAVATAAVVVVMVVVAGAAGVSEWDIREHLASMTPYEWAGSGGAITPYTPPFGCELLSLYLVARHGSRYPTSKNIKAFDKLAELLARHSGEVTQPWMVGWRNPFQDDDQGLLSQRGIDEHVGLGKRFAARFKSAVLPYRPNLVSFTSSQSPRTAQSAGAFGQGMLPSWAPIAVLSESTTKDLVLRFFQNCQRYQVEVATNPAATAEARAFLDARRAVIAKRISARTGLPFDEVAAKDMIEAMWDLCGSEVAALDEIHHWCNVFDPQDVLALEFTDDLDSWWTRGYGYPIDYLIAEPLLKDIVAGMDAASQRRNGTADGRPNARLRFAHAETVLPFAALLGLFRDAEPLVANWTDEQIAARKWRFGSVAPLGSSIAFALYGCSGTPYVELLHNEMSTLLPGCNGLRLCPLAQFKSIFADVLAIDWDKLCSVPK